MAVFILTCVDKPDSLALRMATREAHLAYLATVRDQILKAGPLLDEKGDMAGSHFILDVPDLATARALNANDPYSKAGLFGHVHLMAWKVTVGEL